MNTEVFPVVVDIPADRRNLRASAWSDVTPPGGAERALHPLPQREAATTPHPKMGRRCYRATARVALAWRSTLQGAFHLREMEAVPLHCTGSHRPACANVPKNKRAAGVRPRGVAPPASPLSHLTVAGVRDPLLPWAWFPSRMLPCLRWTTGHPGARSHFRFHGSRCKQRHRARMRLYGGETFRCRSIEILLGFLTSKSGSTSRPEPASCRSHRFPGCRVQVCMHRANFAPTVQPPFSAKTLSNSFPI